MKKQLLVLVITLLISITATFAQEGYNRAAIFLSKPSSEEEFKNVFHKDATAADNALLSQQVPHELATITTNGKSKNDFNTFAKNNSSTLNVIIIGHNENGVLYLPNGSSIPFKDIEDKFKESRVIFLSCRSASHAQASSIGTSFNLPFEDAYILAGRINSYYKNCNWAFHNEADINNDLKKIISDFGIERKYNLSTTVVTVGTVGTGLWYVTTGSKSDENGQKKRPSLR